MTGYVYTIAGGKGGVGKTTTAINVAVSLQDAGHDVVVVDADLGMANLGAMLDVDHSPSLHQVLAGKAAVSDAIIEGPGGITVVPGERNLEAFADADPAKLRKVVKALSTAYEIVLIDTGAGLSHETTVPLGLADGVLLVTTADEVAIGDTIKTAQLAERIDGDVVGAVLTRADDDTNVSEVADKLDMEMLAVVPEDQDATRNEPLLINDPDSYAAEAYRRLASTLEEIYEANTEGGVEPDKEFEPSATPDTDEESLDESEGDDDGDDDEDDEEGVFGLFN
ncbi:septum site-determining protein MinD [Halorientalis persicus]|jgi:septum site-determining protein MinD|uniref:Septum site-determining protein MinD n=1 Tax=Halorientalis persicus TaxID=1367881 RepID=A0A1H8I7E6_9EURY|nr:AAA family ATPase [Halorientalis persicus]SEN64231.1 septum site-determining protein MinD [Halorientalis persicus]